MRNLALSFSANSPRAAPVPRLIAVSRASGHVVSCARARARNFVASRTISIFSVSLWSVIVCVRIHAVIKTLTSLRHDTWRAGRTMDPSFDAAKITSNLLCASRLCVSDAAEEAASAQMPRHSQFCRVADDFHLFDESVAARARSSHPRAPKKRILFPEWGGA